MGDIFKCFNLTLVLNSLKLLQLAAKAQTSFAIAHCASQRCPLDKLLMLAAKAQTCLAFVRLLVTFRPWRGITFAMRIHWRTSRTLRVQWLFQRKIWLQYK